MAQERNSRRSSCQEAYRRMNERAKARLDWKFEVAFGLLELFDRVVSTVGLFPWVKVTKCSGPAEWHRCRHSVIPELNPWISLRSPLSILTESAPGCRPCSNG